MRPTALPQPPACLGSLCRSQGMGWVRATTQWGPQQGQGGVQSSRRREGPPRATQPTVEGSTSRTLQPQPPCATFQGPRPVILGSPGLSVRLGLGLLAPWPGW